MNVTGYVTGWVGEWKAGWLGGRAEGQREVPLWAWILRWSVSRWLWLGGGAHLARCWLCSPTIPTQAQKVLEKECAGKGQPPPSALEMSNFMLFGVCEKLL